jgi:hypothetical protein
MKTIFSTLFKSCLIFMFLIVYMVYVCAWRFFSKARQAYLYCNKVLFEASSTAQWGKSGYERTDEIEISGLS